MGRVESLAGAGADRGRASLSGGAPADDLFALRVGRGAGAGLPVSFVRTPGGGLTENCLSCHAGKVAGRYIPGLGNSNYTGDALASDVALLMQREKLAPPPGTVAWPAGFPTPQSVNAVGVNNAFGVSPIFWRCGTRTSISRPSRSTHCRRQACSYLTRPRLGGERSGRNSYYWDGFAQRSIREGMMQFTATPANSAEADQEF